MEYPVIIVPLSEEDGGGYMGYAPDLLGCMSDGEAPEEAIANTRDAIAEWIIVANQRGMDIPAPHSAAMRQREENERIVRALKELTNDVGDLHARMDKIERAMSALEERLEHDDAWSRFVSIVGLPDEQQPLPHVFQ